MIPVKQTRLGSTGNCFEASIASLMNLNIEDIPDLCAYQDGPWMKKLNKWLEKYKLVYMEVHLLVTEAENFFSDKDFYHVIVGDTSRRTGIKHAVVGRKGKMVHDPHPDHAGILQGEMLHIGILVNQCL